MLHDELHPLDRQKLRHIAEALCDISAGRRQTRDGLESQLAVLMVCIRPDCSAAGADGVLDRLLAVADHRLGAEEMGSIVLAEIMAAEVRS